MYLNKLTVLLIVIVYFEVKETCHALIIIEGETKQHSKGIAEDTCKLECRGSICIDVNKCRCDTGFAIMKKGNPQCIPKCVSGYEYVDGVCKPQCSKPCLGGKCIAPDLCICPGDLKLIDGQCIPTCHPECGNGTCIDVNKCTCWYGYELRKSTNPQCVLKCNSGYEMVDGVCQPSCSKLCRGAKCLAPENCLCADGWELNNHRKCIPTCNPVCGSGGECVAPNKCRCKEPSITVYLTDNNQSCDCLDDCDIICNKTVCRSPRE